MPNFGQSPCACCCDHARRQNTDAALLHPEALPSDEYAALCEIVWPRVSSAERNRVLSVWFNQVRGLTDAVLWVWRPPPPVSDNMPSLCCSPATAKRHANGSARARRSNTSGHGVRRPTEQTI